MESTMFAVIFEVQPRADRWDDYLGLAGTLGRPHAAEGLVGWDLFDAILTPGDLLLMLAWRDAALAPAASHGIPSAARHRQVRVVRDYGMFRRNEAPQFYEAVQRETS